MRRARTSCFGFSVRQLRHTCRKPIVSDNGAVDAAVMRQSCCVDRKLRARKRACAWRGPLDKTFAFLEEQIAWLNALSLDAVQGSGKVSGYINLSVRRSVAELRQRLSWFGKLPYLFVNATDPTVANLILKSWRSLPKASHHLVTVRNCMLWEADLQRIANHETDAIFHRRPSMSRRSFRRMRLSSSSSEGWHCSVRLVKVRSNRSRIPWLFSSQRLPQNLQTIRTFEAMPSGRNSIRFEWHRCSRVLQAQRRKAVAASHQAVFRQRRVYRLGKHSLTNWSLWADEDSRRLDGAVGEARPSLTDYQKTKAQYLRQCLAVGSVLEVEGAADDAPPVLFLVLAVSVSGVRAPATNGRVEAMTLGC